MGINVSVALYQFNQYRVHVEPQYRYAYSSLINWSYRTYMY